MIEDIKREIEQELTNIGKTIEDDGLISIRHLFEILDKYKDIDKYKNAWEELESVINDYASSGISNQKIKIESLIKCKDIISKKYNIRKEDLDE